MSDISPTLLHEQSPLSEEKMDTASESFPTSHQASSSSDCEIKDDNYLDDPPVLRLAVPLNYRNDSENDSVECNDNGKAKNHLFFNPPIVISTLTLTEDHPLMSLSSPESPPSTGYFPDSQSHRAKYKGREGFRDAFNSDYSGVHNLSSAEDECFNRNIIGGELCSLYGEGPQRNTSKNNLYISDNLLSPDSNKSVGDGDELINHSNMNSKFNMETWHLVDSERRHNYSADVICCSLNNRRHFVNESQHVTTVTERINNFVDNKCLECFDESSIRKCSTKEGNSSLRNNLCVEDVRSNNIGKSSWSHSESSSSAQSLCDCSDKSDEEEEVLFKDSCDKKSSKLREKIPEYSLQDERTESKKWLKVILPSGERRSVDMKVIEPYKRVLSHGGYALSGRRDAIVVFSACFLPDSCRVDYNYVMDNLFLYVLTTMEQLVTDDYILIYLHGSASKHSMPTFHWLKKCYQLIDRRLRKSLKHLYLVHPTFWLKSIVFMTRPFISSKFFTKLTYVHSLDELSNYVPVEYAAIPERVRRFDSSKS